MRPAQLQPLRRGAAELLRAGPRTDPARSLGLSPTDLGRQVRSAFFGAEALREQRGRDEVKVMVRLPEDQRRTEYDIEQLQVRTAAGGGVPFGAVASVTRGQAPTVIRRGDGRRSRYRES